MKTVFILLAMLIISVSAADHDIDAMVNHSLLIQPDTVTVDGDYIPNVKMYTIHWEDGKHIEAYRFKSGSWSFNVSLISNVTYQGSYDGENCTGLLKPETCAKILQVIRDNREWVSW